MTSIGVVGAGAFGTALAVAWGRAGRTVVLWGRDAAAMAAARDGRGFARLPGVDRPDGVHPTSRTADLADCDVVVVAVPTQTLADVLAGLPPLRPRMAVAACKGIDMRRLRGPTDLLAEAWPQVPAGILSGPGFAAEIAAGRPTALALAAADAARLADVQTALSTPVLRLYRSGDVRGVELGGALKNPIAIACGVSAGLDLGESARAALMTRGMAEMTRLATALGARPATLSGLSGLGDLALTCGSPQSRNFALGRALGAGAAPARATTEGVSTAAAALDLAARHDVAMPVTAAVHALVGGAIRAEDAMDALLARDLTEE